MELIVADFITTEALLNSWEMMVKAAPSSRRATKMMALKAMSLISSRMTLIRWMRARTDLKSP